MVIIQYVEHAEGHGDKMFAAVCDLGLEGIVSKTTPPPRPRPQRPQPSTQPIVPIKNQRKRKTYKISAFGTKQTYRVALHMSAFRGRADMTVCGNPLSRSLSGAKRTCLFALHTSAIGGKADIRYFALHMSAFDPKRT